MIQAGLTRSQYTALVFLKTFIAENGYAPSYREIAAGCGYASTGAAANIVSKLIERGHIERLVGKHRSLSVVQQIDSEHSVSRETFPVSGDTRTDQSSETEDQRIGELRQ